MPFAKGTSGNLHGARVKSVEQREFEAKCKQWCKEFAYTLLVKKAFSEDDKVSTWALEALLNRAFGKPVETSVIEANVTASLGCSAQEIAGELAEIIPGGAPEGVGAVIEGSLDAGK